MSDSARPPPCYKNYHAFDLTQTSACVLAKASHMRKQQWQLNNGSRYDSHHASVESYNTYPEDYVPPFKYYTENSDGECFWRK